MTAYRAESPHRGPALHEAPPTPWWHLWRRLRWWHLWRRLRWWQGEPSRWSNRYLRRLRVARMAKPLGPTTIETSYVLKKQVDVTDYWSDRITNPLVADDDARVPPNVPNRKIHR